MSETGQGRAQGRGRRARRPESNAEESHLNAHPSTNSEPTSALNQLNTRRLVPNGRGRARNSAVSEKMPSVCASHAHPSSSPDSNYANYSSGKCAQTGAGRPSQTNALPLTSTSSGPLEGKVDQKLVPDDTERQNVKEYQRRLPCEKYVDPQWHPNTLVKTGSSGRPRSLLTNYISVSMPQTIKLYQYHVTFTPIVENIKIKYALVYSLSEYTGTVRHFDGSTLFLNRLLPKNPFVCKTERTFDHTIVEVAFNHTCDVPQGSPQFLQIANGLLNKVQEALNMKRIREHYFNTHLSVRIPGAKLEVMPGFTTAIGTFDGGPMMNVDVIHKILRIDTCYDVMCDLRHRITNAREFQYTFMKKYIGTIVLTRYNNKTYRIDDVAWDKNAEDTFDKNGMEISYEKYYKDNWNLEIQDVKQPLLITRPTDRDVRGGRKQNHFLVPEFCVITGFDDETRLALSDGRLKNQLSLHTRIGPEKRVETLESFISQINSSERVGQILHPWGMSIGSHVMEIPSRQLDAEKLLVGGAQGQNLISYEMDRADWSYSLRNCHLLHPVAISSWMIIYPDRCRQLALDLCNGLMRVSKGFGIPTNHPTMVGLISDRNEAYLQAIRQQLTSEIKMVLVLVPNNNKDRYDAVKKCLCIDHPVPSQVVVASTVQKKGFLSICSKIVMQISCKIGGEIWGAIIPMKKRLMVVGIDAYHDSVHKNQSVGAMVASLNKQCTRYYSRTETHDCKVETMSNLSVLMAAALKKYNEVNSGLPDIIVVFRDGVGDGALKAVFKSEKEQLDQAFRMVNSDYNPGLAFVVVKKRISTRFFSGSKQGLQNPQSGTIVDRVVTKPDWYDFFLVSQSVRQGTVTPTSYNVIYDTSQFQPDHMQKLAYKMTHLYFNWQGTIRVPAPCQYAHKLAYLQGQSLHREPNESLSDKLYYL